MKQTPSIIVSGPELEDRSAASVSAGISLAQGHACRPGPEGTFYVRLDGRVTHHVQRERDGSVTTRAVA